MHYRIQFNNIFRRHLVFKDGWTKKIVEKQKKHTHTWRGHCKWKVSYRTVQKRSADRTHFSWSFKFDVRPFKWINWKCHWTNGLWKKNARSWSSCPIRIYCNYHRQDDNDDTFIRVKKEKRKVQTLNKTENSVSKMTLPTKEKYSHNLARCILHLLLNSQMSALFQHYFSNRHPFWE